MTSEKMYEYSMKYKKTSKKIILGLTIFIFIIALLLVIASIFIFINFSEWDLYLVAAVILILAIADTFLGIKFYKSTINSLNNMKDKTACEKYCRIMGIGE